MSMFSDIATEGTIRSAVEFIKDQLSNEQTPIVRRALRKTGRHLLTLFDWDTPAWVKDEGYDELFRARGDEP